jgi:hypothetical protein
MLMPRRRRQLADVTFLFQKAARQKSMGSGRIPYQAFCVSAETNPAQDAKSAWGGCPMR